MDVHANFHELGDVSIFRPSLETEEIVRRRGRLHLLSRFSPGEYRGAKAANSVIQHQFEFYDRMLRPLFPILTAFGAAQFLLFQYDEATRLLHGNGILDLQERQRWGEIEPVFKHAIKYLVEMICLAECEPTRRPDQNVALFALETALVCAESMVALGQESDTVHAVFPDDCFVRVYDSGPMDFQIGVDGKYAGFDRELTDRIKRDRNSRGRFVDFPQFDNHTATHQKHLDDAFTHLFGMSYGEFIAVIIATIEGSQPSLHPKSFPTLFIHRGRAVEQLAKWEPPRDTAAIERAINGFSISPANLAAEQRVVYNPKQEYRAYRRGFFVFPHETGSHLAFSRAMAKECLMQLVFWVCFKRLPPEWQAPETTKALEPLSHAASEWFENVARKNFQCLGFTGGRVKRTAGAGAHKVSVPDSVGEIDFLGYDGKRRLLVVSEAKMTMPGLEARYWRDDIHEFVTRSGSYAERFRRKIAWVNENRCALAKALGFGGVDRVEAVMLTLYPCIAKTFIDDFPCVSITEFMLDYERAREWPYTAGIPKRAG